MRIDPDVRDNVLHDRLPSMRLWRLRALTRESGGSVHRVACRKALQRTDGEPVTPYCLRGQFLRRQIDSQCALSFLAPTKTSESAWIAVLDSEPSDTSLKIATSGTIVMIDSLRASGGSWSKEGNNYVTSKARLLLGFNLPSDAASVPAFIGSLDTLSGAFEQGSHGKGTIKFVRSK